jgi:REP element-mobilizing transposase RayT
MNIDGLEGSGGRPDRHSEKSASDSRVSFQRRQLHHTTPDWVKAGSIFFITVCCERRDENQLCHQEIGTALLDSARYYHLRERWFVRLLILMPDHFHALLSFPPDEKPAEVLRNWKSYTARQLLISWQRDFFEHRLRNEDELRLKADYIRQNPVRKGLITDASKWQYVLEH